MASKIKYPGTVSQDTSNPMGVPFDNLSNIRNNVEGSWAVSRTLITGKYGNKPFPCSITCKNFNFDLPQGAEPTKVVVHYRHRKVHGNDYSTKHPKRIMNIGGPLIILRGVDNHFDEVKETNFYGVAPKSDGMHTQTKTFKLIGATRAMINSANFGVWMSYPSNTNDWDGYMRISFVRMEVFYTVPAYTVSVKKSGGSGYNHEDYTVQLSISNKNRTDYNPSLTLSSPLGFTFKKVESGGQGIFTKNSARSFTWNPKLSSKVGTSSIDVVFTPDVTYPSGSSSYSGTFTLSESLYSGYSNHTAVITERPPAPSEEDEGGSVLPDGGTGSVTELTVINVVEGNDFVLDLGELPYSSYNYTILGFDGLTLDDIDYDGSYYDRYNVYDEETHITGVEYKFLQDSADFVIDGNWNITKPILCNVVVYTKVADKPKRELSSFSINILPEEDSLSIPFLTLFQLSEEELNRLGSGYTYMVQSDIEHTTEDSYIRDWYKNNRIGVFNNPITDNITVTDVEDPETGEVTETITDTTDYDNLTVEEIFTYADYWSQDTAGHNEYNNVECEFTYNEDYPLYIIMTGDYSEAEDYDFDIGTVKYDAPCIIEKTVYNAREQNGNYPEPIEKVIGTDDSAELTIPTLETSTPVIIYDFPLEEGTGNDDTHSIRGLEVTGHIEQTDELVLYAKLTNPDGISGQRSLILNNEETTIDSDNYFKLGGLGDLWGFSINEIYNLEDWELELTVNNLLLDSDSNINFNGVQLTVYTETLEKQRINIAINGEDISYYGAFIEEVKIPEGLETDTSFLTIDGTDTNDAYRQNIREKTIDLKISIGECDIQTSTDMLRQLTKLLVNEKDQYNRPIPNIIEFSHYPDVYFEYIMKDALDVDEKTGSYNLTAKLTIPSGTAYSKESVTTNIIGFVQGLAAVNPLISFKPQSNSIEITELFTGQSFTMGYDGDWQSKVVTIDCEDRAVYLSDNEDSTEQVDISKYVDFNSDWFSLYGEYSFSGTGCVIRTVEYTERW